MFWFGIGVFCFIKLKNWREIKFELKAVFSFLLEFLMSFSSSFNKTEVNRKQTLVLNNVIERLSLKCQHQMFQCFQT